MKKKLLAAIVVLCLLTVALPTAASASGITLYAGLSYEKTEITSVSPDEECTISLTGAPVQTQYGITVTSEIGEDGVLRISYSGTPEKVCSLTFTISYLNGEEAASQDISFDVLETPVVPTVTAFTPENDVLSVAQAEAPVSFSVSATGNGTLGYTWYLDGEEAGSGSSFTLDPAVTAVGDHMLWCIVKNTNGSMVAETGDESPAWRISVTEIEPLEITGTATAASINGTGTAKFVVEAKGTELKYQWYVLDGTARSALSNGKVSVIEYSGATAATLKIGCNMAPKDVTARYICEVTDIEGNVAETEVYILYIMEDPAASKVDSISVTRMPEKTEYVTGETLNLAGFELTAVMPKGSEVVESGYAVDPMLLETEGRQVITVSYSGKTTNFTVNVKKADHEHDWNGWELDEDLECVYRTCKVSDCSAREIYAYEKFSELFPEEAKKLGIVKDEKEDTEVPDDEDDLDDVEPVEDDKKADKSEEKTGKKDKKKSGDAVLWIIIIVALLLLAAAGYLYFKFYRGVPKKKNTRK